MKTINSIVKEAQKEAIAKKMVFVYFETTDPLGSMSDGFWLFSEDPSKIAMVVSMAFSHECLDKRTGLECEKSPPK